MNVLLDTCMWGLIIDPLIEAGHDVVWAGLWPDDPGDMAILALAYREGRVLITLDKDFGELAIVQQLPHAGIVRLVDFSVSQQAALCITVLERYADELADGAIITVDPRRVLIRPGQQRNDHNLE